MELGTIGIWRTNRQGIDTVPLLDELGFGTLWMGGSPGVEEMRAYLEATSAMTIATGILNVWQHEPADVAAQFAVVAGDFPDRFLLGIGIGHPEATSEYRKPLATMRAFLDGLDAAAQPVPREQRIVAALGPKMLELAAARSLGGDDRVRPDRRPRDPRVLDGNEVRVGAEVAVVVEPDAATARGLAREYAARYLATSNYTLNLERLGYTEAEFADGGSDRLIDAVIPHGSPDDIRAAVDRHLDAGADHVCLQPLGHGELPIDDYRALAPTGPRA
jgi:probable F420-dependent oxidoreductase